VKFKNVSPGKFNIVALNDMLESPPNLAGYEHDIKRIAVETLRDFEYDTVNGQCRFYGREGTGFLHMIGPTGSAQHRPQRLLTIAGSPRAQKSRRRIEGGLLLAALLLPSCKIPDINLATPKPIEVDLNMRLDVYQYAGDEPKDKEQQKTLAETGGTPAPIVPRRFRPSKTTASSVRIIAGFSQLREVPAGDWGLCGSAWWRPRTRTAPCSCASEAAKTNRALNEVQTEQVETAHRQGLQGRMDRNPRRQRGQLQVGASHGAEGEETCYHATMILPSVIPESAHLQLMKTLLIVSLPSPPCWLPPTQMKRPSEPMCRSSRAS